MRQKTFSYGMGKAAVADYAPQLVGLDQRVLSLWAAACAQHVLWYFEDEHPDDQRPRRAIEAARAWARGAILLTEARAAAVAGHAAARMCEHPAAQAAARAAGHAAGTAHMARHAIEAAAYAITAAAAAKPEYVEEAVACEREWQVQERERVQGSGFGNNDS
jgi:hypothetical protein